MNGRLEVLQAGQRALEQGDLGAARQVLSELSEYPDVADQALRLLAVVERRDGNHSLARRYLESLINRHPGDPVLYNNLGNCLKDIGLTGQALQQYRKALEIRNDYGDAAMNLALLLKREERSSEAVQLVVDVLSRARGHTGLWHVLALLYREQGQLESAIDALDQGLSLSPGSEKLLHIRARIEAERGHGALHHYEQALRVAPDNPDVMLGHAVALNESGNAEEAESRLRLLTRQFPLWVKGHVALAQMLWQRGSTDRFVDSFREAIDRHPGNRDVYIGYFGTLMRAGRYRQVLDEIGDARRALGDPLLLDRYAAVCSSECGDTDQAESWFRSSLSDEDTELQVAYLRQLLRTERYRQASELGWRQATLHDSMAAWPYLWLAWRMLDDERSEWLDGSNQLVGVYDMEEFESSRPALSGLLRNQHRTVLHPFDQSMRGGTQTDGNLLSRSDPELIRLKRRVETAVDEYIGSLPQRDELHPFLRHRSARAEFMASYSVLLRSGGHHVSHMHPDAWISCCFYVDTPSSIGDSAKDPAGWLTIGSPPAGLGINLPPRHLIRPEPGRLVIFPSILWHGTAPFPEGERLSVVSDLVHRY